MFSSVRSRITLFATAVVGLALLLASFFILRMVESDLIATTERALQAELELQAAELNAQGFDSQVFFEFQVDGRDLSFGVFNEQPELFAVGSLYDGNVWIADVLLDLETAEVIEVINPVTGTTINDPTLTGALENAAFDVFDLDGDNGDRFLVGAVARDEVDSSLGAVRSALTLIVPMLILAMGALIWWLVGRALQPVQAISTQVQSISTTSLDQRVPVPGGSDEIASLATVMNGMLARLEHGDQRQRQFAADASHELRSPLSSVRAAAEIIERNPDSARTEGLAGDIVAEADRMDHLIGHMLELARSENGAVGAHAELVDLGDLVRRFAAGCEIRIDANVMVASEPGALERLVSNLATNAKRHARDRVVATVSSNVDDGSNAWAVLRVDDDGAGVPEADRTVIFERFSRLDEARSRDRGGAGLGLALVNDIVRRHGGTISVGESLELGGASFVVHLPAAVTEF